MVDNTGFSKFIFSEFYVDTPPKKGYMLANFSLEAKKGWKRLYDALTGLDFMGYEGL